jgi:hypothetical protein
LGQKRKESKKNKEKVTIFKQSFFFLFKILLMESVTFIFILGGITFLVNWGLLVLRTQNTNNDEAWSKQAIRLISYFLISSLGVLASGVLFVSVFMIAHG